MAFLFGVDRVLYECSCESRYPLCRLYFCRYCVTLRCADCTQHEADVYFCPQCLQSHMAPEAKMYHMKCKTCFECPCCQCVMSLRAITQAGDESGSAAATGSATTSGSSADTVSTDKVTGTPKKRYYLACGNCHWSTRDSGYDDKELSALHESFFDTDEAVVKQLRESYQLINLRDAVSDRAVRSKVVSVSSQSSGSSSRRKNLAALALRDDQSQYVLASKMAQLTTGISSLVRTKQLANISTSDILKDVMSVASDDVQSLPEDVYTRPIDLSLSTSLEQRHRDVSQQPQTSLQFRPNRKRLAIKKSIRCKQCDHSLCKPEFSTSNIKFKIQLLAQLQLPDVRIHPGYDLQPDQECSFVLSVSNPDQLSPCSFTLLPDNSHPMSTCAVTTPHVQFHLEPKNEAFSLDDSVETDPEKERWLAYNHGSKIALKCSVTVPTLSDEVSVHDVKRSSLYDILTMSQSKPGKTTKSRVLTSNPPKGPGSNSKSAVPTVQSNPCTPPPISTPIQQPTPPTGCKPSGSVSRPGSSRNSTGRPASMNSPASAAHSPSHHNIQMSADSSLHVLTRQKSQLSPLPGDSADAGKLVTTIGRYHTIVPPINRIPTPGRPGSRSYSVMAETPLPLLSHDTEHVGGGSRCDYDHAIDSVTEENYPTGSPRLAHPLENPRYINTPAEDWLYGAARDDPARDKQSSSMMPYLNLPEEPVEGEERLRLAIRLPNGSRRERYFRPDHPLQAVIDYASVETGENLQSYTLRTTDSHYHTMSHTLTQCHIGDRTLLQLVEPPD